MAEFHYSGEDWSANIARFGLSEQVNDAVSDYYALLFDNVKEFVEINRNELKEYEAENAELQRGLDSRDLGDADRKTLTAQKEKAQEQIQRLREFMNSRRILERGIEFSGEILDDSEPDLTDRFNAAPIIDKYACLLKHYMEEYRTELDSRVNLSHTISMEAAASVDAHRCNRPSTWDALTSFGSAEKQWGERLSILEHAADSSSKEWLALQAYAETSSLVDIDAFVFGAEKTKDFFPKIVEQYNAHKLAEHRVLLETDPVKLHSDLLVKYSTEYIADAGKRLLEVQSNREALQLGLQEHDAAKPGRLKNMAALGHAWATWESEQERLVREVAGCEKQIAELQKIREGGKEAWLSEPARKHAKGEIRSRHPEVAEACERHMDRHWKQTNEERLAKQESRQAARESPAEKTLDNGSSRHM